MPYKVQKNNFRNNKFYDNYYYNKMKKEQN